MGNLKDYIALVVILTLIIIIAFLQYNGNNEPAIMTQQEVSIKQNEINVREVARLESVVTNLQNQNDILSQAVLEMSKADTTGIVASVMSKYCIRPNQVK